MKNRKLIGLTALNKAVELVRDRIPISTTVRLLKLDKEMHYRTAFDIIKADIKGYYSATRPEWLEHSPDIQESPVDSHLTNGMEEDSYWYTAN